MNIEEKLKDVEAENRRLIENAQNEKKNVNVLTYSFMFVVAAYYAIFIGGPEVASSSAPLAVVVQLILSLVCGGLALGLALITTAIFTTITTDEKKVFAIICAVLLIILIISTY